MIGGALGGALLVGFQRLTLDHGSAPGFFRPQPSPAALAGMLLVTSYLCFGLTEVIFWSVKASLLYVLMVFILMGMCLNTKEQERT